MLAILVASLTVFVSAQAKVNDPVPPISFSEWVPERVDDDEQEEFRLQFPSVVTTGNVQNDQVTLRVILPRRRSGPVPVVVLLHYWGAADQRVERSLAGDLARKGVASAMVALPYHMERTPPGARSGERAILPDPEHLVGTMTQAVLDVRRAVDFLVTRPELDSQRIGLAGTSLGSIVGSLVYALEPRIGTAAFMLGGVDLAHILWHSSRVVKVRDELRKDGYTEDRLRVALSAVEPMNYLKERRGRAFVIGGKFDTVVPPADTQKLIDAMPGAETLWLDTGHYGGVFVQRRVMKLVAEFFAVEFSTGGFVPPKKLYAPTLRIAVQANTESGMQVGIGIDLWRSNARGDFFSSFVLTPRGPQLFFGARIDRGLAIGGFATPKRFSPGVFWSTVL